MTFQYSDISKMIDHSLLQPMLTVADLEAGCKLARDYDAASVCILPYYVKRCAEILAGSTVKASTTIGFPHGGHTTAIKVAEALQALKDGCQELDMVVNISQVLSGQWDYVRQEIQEITAAAHSAGQKIKVIFENCYLQDSDKIRLCEICGELNCDWVKTSTGYGTGPFGWGRAASGSPLPPPAGAAPLRRCFPVSSFHPVRSQHSRLCGRVNP